MPLHYARRLTGRHRTVKADRQIGLVLTFVAGATNAGAFLAVHQYTSHMTGIVSSMADHVVLGAWDVVLGGLGALLAFIAGAACSAMMVNFGRRHRLHSEYAGPLLLEAALLLAFGLLGSRLAGLHAYYVSVTVMLLCFTMGLQNALITKLSQAEIRTTHVTGLVTDIGIELGKLAYWNRSQPPGEDVPRVLANRGRLALLSMLLLSFFCGGVAGAWAFNGYGYIATVPLAILLAIISAPPALDDIRAQWQRRRASRGA